MVAARVIDRARADGSAEARRALFQRVPACGQGRIRNVTMPNWKLLCCPDRTSSGRRLHPDCQSAEVKLRSMPSGSTHGRSRRTTKRSTGRVRTVCWFCPIRTSASGSSKTRWTTIRLVPRVPTRCFLPQTSTLSSQAMTGNLHTGIFALTNSTRASLPCSRTKLPQLPIESLHVVHCESGGSRLPVSEIRRSE